MGLLYSPSNTEGEIISSFGVQPRSFQTHVEAFVAMAGILRLLKFIPNWGPSSSLQVPHNLISVPADWSLNSIGSILLSLTSVDIELVKEYFLAHYDAGLEVYAYQVLAAVMSVSPHFTAYASSESTVTGSTVKQLVCSVVNCAQLSSRRSTVIKNIWAVVHQHASNLLQDATNRGRNPQQVTVYDPVIMFASPAGNGGEG